MDRPHWSILGLPPTSSIVGSFLSLGFGTKAFLLKYGSHYYHLCPLHLKTGLRGSMKRDGCLCSKGHIILPWLCHIWLPTLSLHPALDASFYS